MHLNGTFDFGYPWWLSYGHLVILIPSAALLFAAWRGRWRRWVTVTLAALTLWSAAGTAVLRSFGANRVPSLLTEQFLASGKGRVLDIGAGTGRSSIMVLNARPDVTLVASDLFAASFDHHFGPGSKPQDRLLHNLHEAHVDDRATIETADMLNLPFESASFDGVVSAYAMDHVGGDGARRALAEAHRVLKPGGDFLLILVANDAWTRLAFGPVLSHGGLRSTAWWSDRAAEAGFNIVEQGTRPATRYFLMRPRPAGH